MAFVVRFHRLALDELRSARDWYAEQSDTAPTLFRNAKILAIDQIVDRGVSLPKAFGEFHYVRVQRFPYVMFGQKPDLSLQVVAIAHMSRRVGYWRRRK